MPAPRLVPVAPTQGNPVAIDRSPFWIGSSSSNGLRVYLPGVADRHASISEREDGFYLSPFSPSNAVRLGGRAVTGPTKLDDGAVLELGPAARYEFVTGAPRTQPEAPAEPIYGEVADSKRSWWKRRRRGHRKGRGLPVWGWVVIGVLVAGIVVVGVRVIQSLKQATAEPVEPPQLNLVEGQIYDSLMVEATGHIERGASLLDMGLKDSARVELARATTTLEASRLAKNPWVEQAIAAVRKTVEDLYRGNGFSLPPGWKSAPGKVFALGVNNLSANLSSDEFLTSVERVKAAFSNQFRKPVRVTGEDHPEHLSLYGPHSAMDIGVRELTRPEVSFLVDAFGNQRIRVKDFSNDAVLKAQIAAATKAGLADRAGTGLHIHIDRFRDRHDQWTVRR